MYFALLSPSTPTDGEMPVIAPTPTPSVCREYLTQSVSLKCCFTSTETEGLLGTGAHDGHLDFHTVPEL